LHGRILLEPANINRTNAAKRAVTFNIAFRLRSGDLILMNAGLAKPIPQFLVYSTQVIDPAQTLAAAPAMIGEVLTIVSATIARGAMEALVRRTISSELRCRRLRCQ